MPPERSAPSDQGRLSVGVDATPLLGQPTGVGVFCAGALSGLGALSRLEVSAFAVSWRRRHRIAALVPAGVTTRQRAMPARPLHASWGRFSGPPVEWFIGAHDVVHGTNFVVPPTRRAGRVVTVHDLTVVLYPELCDAPTRAYPELIRRAAAEGAWVHTPSQFVADQVVAELAVDQDRVRAVHHGIPLPPAGSDPGAPLPFRLPDGCHRYVLAVGTIEPRKDYPLLVSALAPVAASHPDVALVIVGGDGWGIERYLSAVEASPVRSRIVRPGYLDDTALDAALRHASALAYPSLYEGFGFPPLQAMAAGVPVVATAAGAVPEVVGDGAVLTAPGDGDALAGALIRVLDGGADIEALVERARRRSSQFTWKACAEGLASLYADACPAVGPLGSGRGIDRWPPVSRVRTLMMVEQLRRTAPGGIGTYINGLLQGLGALPVEEKPELGLLASRFGGDRSTPDPLSLLGLPLHRSPLPGPALTRAWDHGILRAPTGFDVVHATSLSTLEPGRSAMVVTVHDLLWRRVPDAYPARGRAWHEAALRRALRRADRFVVPADVVADDLEGAGAPRRAITVIPMGSDHLPPPDLGAGAALLSRLGIEGSFLLSVGTLEPRKNQARLIEAYTRIRGSLPEPWPLVLVGPTGWGQQVGPAPGVTLAGLVSPSELSALYAMSRLLAYVPIIEGFGLPPVEAMAFGTPVVASPLPSTAAAAYEVDPHRTDSIADGLLRVATDEDERERLRGLGLERSAELSWTAIARRHITVWDEARSTVRPVRD